MNKIKVKQLLTNYPEAYKKYKSLEDIKLVYFDFAYGVTPALFVIHGEDEKLERIRLNRSE